MTKMVAILTTLLVALITNVVAFNVYLKETCFSTADCDRFKGTLKKCVQTLHVFNSTKASTLNASLQHDPRLNSFIKSIMRKRIRLPPPRRPLNGKRLRSMKPIVGGSRKLCKACVKMKRRVWDKNWKNYYECSKSVNVEKKNYSWVHRNAMMGERRVNEGGYESGMGSDGV
ncbi:hypothetical protein BC829DRAFT_420863 [Chytridium lagenaria]|nr:hypothetical protein BC829DRAFT_420863 [Chytridium lagenaria]